MLVLDHAPMPDEALRIVSAGVQEIQFPFATETMVAGYAASLAASRDILIAAGVRFGVSNLTVDF